MAMAATGQGIVTEDGEHIRLNGTDHRLLNYLDDGRITPELGRRLMIDKSSVEEVSRQYVNERLVRLAEHGIVENLYNLGLYELVEDPR